LIFGQALFADIPFAEIGEPPFIDTGWLGTGPDPCDREPWVKVPKKQSGIDKCEKPPTNWTPVK
jgi:hypothetical protein